MPRTMQRVSMMRLSKALGRIASGMRLVWVGQSDELSNRGISNASTDARLPLRPAQHSFQCSTRAGMQRASLRHVIIFSCAAFLFLIAAVSAKAQAQAPLLRLQLHWTHQAQFAGYYVAKELCFYRRAGIDIDLAPGGVNV